MAEEEINGSVQEEDLETQMAAAMDEEAEGGSDEDDLEAQMAAEIAAESADMDEDDLEAQMAAALDGEGENGFDGSLLEGVSEESLGEDAGVAVQSAEFQQLRPSDENVDKSNIDRLLDVVLNLSVELGRKQMQIKEILDLGPGKIIELDKLAGEPVDLLVNGKLLAKGEVVVVDENFGVRITDLITPMDRIKSLQ
ncbi:MAG: flagellar motor switch protein FliN [Candidatus Latescibacteria bacterium]|jgi:flagellar motor switch protein FliN|nr:flagellar motor switch protein FliN [Candidatus Latescibacterota bacterium]